jgi:tRNA 2-(methylsulfanyl)-N6-isopentenyladenosine37 hydroxylase
MLALAVPTSSAWLARALANLDAVLVDHAHCEKKAASTAVSLLFRYPERQALLPVLSALAREELTHFEQVLALLARRGVPYGRLTPSPYATELLAAVRPEEPRRLVDTLLCLALIEARSCERMKLLADAVDDADLAAFYRGLLASEARHHRTYLHLAESVASVGKARARLAELAMHEAAVIDAAPAIPRMHT